MSNLVYFVAGIHGVGKSSLAMEVSKGLSISAFSAGELIRQTDPRRVYPDKLVDELIYENQEILIRQVDLLKKKYPKLILDGHLCLLDKNAQVVPLPYEVFGRLEITRLLLMTTDETIIKSRLKERSNMNISIRTVTALQAQEEYHAKAVANSLGIPLMVYQEAVNTPKDAICFFSEKRCL